jgi:cholesterol transport system auxiliary component
MNQTILRALFLAALLAGCASTKAPQNTLFDFGPVGAPTATAAAPLAALVVTDATGSAALDNERMFYRLMYADPMQARMYANSRWSATPLQLITQRLRSRIAQGGVKVVGPTDASNGIPLLRVEVDDFTHNFDSASQSYGQVVLRASLYQGHTLVDQKTFSRKTDAGSADAAGGTRALAASTDAAAADVLAWLAALARR